MRQKRTNMSLACYFIAMVCVAVANVYFIYSPYYTASVDFQIQKRQDEYKINKLRDEVEREYAAKAESEQDKKNKGKIRYGSSFRM